MILIRKEDIFMQVSGINPQINSYQNNFKQQNVTENKFSNYVRKIKDDQVENLSIFEELSKEYDITNASFNEFETICNKLYEAGQISLLDLGKLTLIPKIIAHAQKLKNYKVNPLLTSTKSTGNWKEEKINWIKEFDARAEQQRKFGAISNYKQYNEFADFFRKYFS